MPGVRLSFQEREAISQGLAARRSLTTIAAGLGRPPSTVSREMVRNGVRAVLGGDCAAGRGGAG